MALGFGKSKNKNKSETNQTQTTTPNVPDFIADPVKALTGKIGGLIDVDPSKFAPASNPLLDSAFKGAEGLVSGAGGLFDKAAGAIGGLDKFLGTAADGIGNWLNPYLDQVVGTTTKNFDKETAKAQANLAAQGARNKSYGGSRFGLAESNLTAEAGDNRAALEAGLRSQGYDKASSLAMTDRAQQQQAALQQAGLFGNLAQAQGADQRDTLAAKMAAGMTQAEFETMIKQFPLEYLQQIGGALGGMGLENFIGQTTTGNSTTKGKSTGFNIAGSYGN